MRKPPVDARAAILASTVELLARREFGDVTLREIAQLARVAPTTVFRHFATKQAILQGIIDELAPRFYRDLEDAVALVDDPRDKLLAVCRQTSRFAARNRGLIRVLHREVHFNHRPAAGLVKSTRRFVQRLADLCRDGVERGAFRKDLDLDAVPLLFYMVVDAVLMRDRLRGVELSDSAFCKAADDSYRLLLDAVEAPRARR